MKKAALSLVLSVAMVFSMAGCSTAWVTTLDNILVAAAPALINILQIIAIAKGVPVNASLASKINADAAAIKTLAADFSAASTAAAPQVCSQLQAAITTYQSDEQTVLSLAQVSDPATQQKVIVLSGLVAGTVEAILAVIPNCQAASKAVKIAGAGPVPLPLKQFVGSYNTELVKATGNAGVDTYTKNHKIHVHNWLVRVVTLGHSY